jgi:hypothetical protein
MLGPRCIAGVEIDTDRTSSYARQGLDGLTQLAATAGYARPRKPRSWEPRRPRLEGAGCCECFGAVAADVGSQSTRRRTTL